MTEPESSRPTSKSERRKKAAAARAAAAKAADIEAAATAAEADADAASTEATAVDVAEPEAADDAPAPPEPWTPERALVWNAYYDIYVMLGVLLLVFVASANKITNSSLWSKLQVGRTIIAKGAPVTADVFSFTRTGQPWVNVSWVFDASHAALHKFTLDTVPADPQDPAASSARAEQIAAGVLVGLNAAARLLTAFFLMRLRRAGPGLWWSAVCTALAVGAVLNPVGLLLGGVAGPGLVSPGTWGMLLLSAELWLLHRAINLGHRRAIYALVPLFLVWANVDESFLPGLLVLAAVAVGRVRPGRLESADAPRPGTLFVVLALSAVVCLANPSHVKIYQAVAEPFAGLFAPESDVQTPDQLSWYGKGIRSESQAGELWTRLFANYAALVLIGYASFYVNRKNFSLSRFLAYTAGVFLWSVLIRFGPEFALLLAAALALNGQEWYHDRLGTEGRVGTGWSLFSVGGRLVTLGLIFYLTVVGLTGYGRTRGDVQFGFGFDPDEFAFEAADFLKTAPIKGEILNTTMGQGDAILWRSYPDHKSYIDSRQHLFPHELLNRVQALRGALSEDDVEGWKALLDEYKVSAVMLPAAKSTRTIRVLSLSPNWIPFYDDGNTLLYGRTDAADPADVAYFKANRLEPEQLAYKTSKATPPASRPPSPVTWMDRIFQARSTTRPQPHTEAARRWLTPPSVDTANGPLPDPARCLIAIREARTALAVKPDDPSAFRLLASAYRDLMIQEGALLAGLTLTPENTPQVRQVVPRSDLLMTRFRQRVTSLNYAIQTTPPPTTTEQKRELQALNLELFQLYASVNFLDLARDRLQAVLDNSVPGDFSAEFRVSLAETLAKLKEQTTEIQNKLNEVAVEQQAGPVQLANLAMSNGAPGVALHELEEAERTGTNPAQVKPQLLDLYSDTGQPDRALEMLSSGTVNDPSLGTEPGVAATRQARAYLLLGNNEYAATLWEKYAIPQVRSDRAVNALSELQTILRGEPKAATAALLTLPDKIGLQATWEFEAGLCRLEAGTPELAAEHFTKALTLAPKMSLRPIAAYYLEKLGQPVPPIPTAATSTGTATAATPTPAAGVKPAPAGTPGEPKKEK